MKGGGRRKEQTRTLFATWKTILSTWSLPPPAGERSVKRERNLPPLHVNFTTSRLPPLVYPSTTHLQTKRSKRNKNNEQSKRKHPHSLPFTSLSRHHCSPLQPIPSKQRIVSDLAFLAYARFSSSWNRMSSFSAETIFVFYFAFFLSEILPSPTRSGLVQSDTAHPPTLFTALPCFGRSEIFFLIHKQKITKHTEIKTQHSLFVV